jgi:hypothetical protein
VNFATPFCALLAAASVFGQEPVPRDAERSAARWLQPQPAEKPLACEVRPLAPALTYRLAYRAGYLLTVPMRQFTDRPRPLEILVRITPQRSGAQPLLLKDVRTFPDGSGEQGRDASKFEAQIRGGFFVGEGEYHAELVLIDGLERVCRKQWDLELKPHKDVETPLPPGGVAALSQLDWPHLGARPGSLTVFLHAGSSQSNHIMLQTLAAILDRLPFSRVQVVAFSLDQHKELLRQNVADASGFLRVAEALRDFNPSTVSYGVLKDPAGHRDFLWQLLAKEGMRAQPADAVLFAGYSTFDDAHVFVPPAPAQGARRTVYAYLDFAQPSRRRSPMSGFARGRMRRLPGADYPIDEPWEDLPQGGPMQPEMPDAISRITRACSGKVFHIHSPGDLASALRKTGELLRGR